MQLFHNLRQTLYVVLPENDNHNVPIATALYDLLESAFEAVAGGWSCPPSGRGSWVNDKGDPCPEPNRMYEITFRHPRDIKTLRRVIQKFCSVIDQDTAYIRVQRSVVFFDRIQQAEQSVTETLPHLPAPTNGHVDVSKTTSTEFSAFIYTALRDFANFIFNVVDYLSWSTVILHRFSKKARR